MNILVVEDDQEFAEAVIDLLKKLDVQTVISHARSMESGIALITSEFYDLIILDLKIPTIDTELNASSAHGIATFTFAMANAPGTPILVLTGSSADEHIDTILKYAKQVDIWGEGQQAKMVDFLRKHKLAELPGKLKLFETAIKKILDIEVTRHKCELSVAHSRIIRIFARTFSAQRCNISMLNGGLSGTAVYRLDTFDMAGNTIHHAVCKVGLMAEIIDESTRYDQHISRLNPVATPRKLVELRSGARDTAGVFYSLAQGYPYTGFDLLKRESEFVGKTIQNLQALFTPWRAGESRKLIRDIRRRVLNDENFETCKANLQVTWVENFERQEVQTSWCCTHGDLHGLNILVSADGAPILIDYGDVGEGPASLDPVTLEFSLVFHPDGPLKGGNWPSVEQAQSWGNLDEYLKDCPCPDFIKACRAWAESVAPARREVAVSAYAYLLRQFKYPSANIELISALIEGAKNMYDDTFK